MAMQYRDPMLDQLVNDHFRVAVASTGFELRRLDDRQTAGLIDVASVWRFNQRAFSLLT
jgi:hypothetical protein